jgi:hypothetical protein
MATYTLDSSSAALVPGDWVTLLSSDPTKVTRATPSAVVPSFPRPVGEAPFGGPGAILGCVDAAYSPGATNVIVRDVADVVPASVFSDLGAGQAMRLQMNANGRAVRQPTWSGGEIRLGTVDANGNVTVDPFVPIDRSPQYEYNPKTYGAVVDGSMDGNALIYGTDDTAAWDAMMTAIINSPLPGKKKIRLPPGYMYIAGHAWSKGCFKLEIPTSVHIEGNGGAGINGTGGIGNSGFILAPMCALVFCNGGASDILPGTANANYSSYEYVNHHTVTPIVANIVTGQSDYSMLGPGYTRQAYITSGKPVPKGACVVKNNATVSTDTFTSATSHTDASGTNNDVMFRANSSFTPSGSDAAKFASATVADIGTTVADGSGSWTVESVPKDRTLFHGQTPRVGQRFLVPGDVRYVWEVIAAPGPLGDQSSYRSNTGYIQPAPWATFSDGACTIRPFMAGTIHVLENEINIEHTSFTGGIGPAVQVEGGALDGVAVGGQPNWATSDFCFIDDLRVFFGYGGVSSHGAEANATRVTRVKIDAPFFQRTISESYDPTLASHGDGSHAVWIRNFGVFSIENCYYLTGSGIGYCFDSSANAKPGLSDPIQGVGGFHCWGNTGESTLTPNIIGGTTIFASTSSQLSIDERCAGMQLGPTRTRGIVGQETSPVPKVTTYGLQTNGLGGVLSYYTQSGVDAGQSNNAPFYLGFWTDICGVIPFFTDRSSLFSSSGWLGYGVGTQTNQQITARIPWAVSYGDARNTSTVMAGSPNITFDGTAHTADRSSGSFKADGFTVGDSVTIAGAVNGGNNTTKPITALTATVMTFASGLVNEGPTAGVSIKRNATGPGVGLLALLDGWFSRNTNGSTSGIYYATDANMLDDERLRYGKRNVGDSFPLPGATYAPGTFRRCVVTGAGYRAPKWTSGTGYVAEYDVFKTEATILRPSSSPDVFTTGTDGVWKLQTLGSGNNAGEPKWPAIGGLTPGVSTFTDGATPTPNTWLFLGTTATVLPYEFISASSTNASAVDLATVGPRLTVITGVPVTSSDVIGASTLYFSPTAHGRIALYDATNWGMYSTNEISLALSSLTSGRNYDVFVFNNAGTLTLELSAAWTNDTTRADAIAQQDGVWVKSSDHKRRFVGTIRATGETTTEDSASKRFVWNLYNQVARKLKKTETTASWAYTTAAYRAANGNTANCFEYVSGLATFLRARVRALADATSAVDVAGGIGIDSTTSTSADLFGGKALATANGHSLVEAEYADWTAFGYHKITWLEYGGTAATFYGAGTAYQAGMTGEVMA